VVAWALELIEETNERTWVAELYRLKGELLIQAGDDVETEACFGQALEIVRH
jgi:predicted negative regulator of RcsB-dependent stress response